MVIFYWFKFSTHSIVNRSTDADFKKRRDMNVIGTVVINYLPITYSINAVCNFLSYITCHALRMNTKAYKRKLCLFVPSSVRSVTAAVGILNCYSSLSVIEFG